jgi:hypothetical protein
MKISEAIHQVVFAGHVETLKRMVDSGANPGGNCRHLKLYIFDIIEGSLEVKLPTIWTAENPSRAEAERRERLEERRVEEKESEERRCRCAKR